MTAHEVENRTGEGLWRAALCAIMNTGTVGLGTSLAGSLTSRSRDAMPVYHPNLQKHSPWPGSDRRWQGAASLCAAGCDSAAAATTSPLAGRCATCARQRCQKSAIS